MGAGWGLPSNSDDHLYHWWLVNGKRACHNGPSVVYFGDKVTERDIAIGDGCLDCLVLVFEAKVLLGVEP